jgi:hypothetical protein
VAVVDARSGDVLRIEELPSDLSGEPTAAVPFVDRPWRIAVSFSSGTVAVLSARRGAHSWKVVDSVSLGDCVPTVVGCSGKRAVAATVDPAESHLKVGSAIVFWNGGSGVPWRQVSLTERGAARELLSGRGVAWKGIVSYESVAASPIPADRGSERRGAAAVRLVDGGLLVAWNDDSGIEPLSPVRDGRSRAVVFDARRAIAMTDESGEIRGAVRELPPVAPEDALAASASVSRDGRRAVATFSNGLASPISCELAKVGRPDSADCGVVSTPPTDSECQRSDFDVAWARDGDSCRAALVRRHARGIGIQHIHSSKWSATTTTTTTTTRRSDCPTLVEVKAALIGAVRISCACTMSY